MTGRGGETLWAIVDADVAPILAKYHWRASTTGFPHPVAEIGNKNGRPKAARLHRLITDASRNRWVIHLNGDPLDCRRANLELTDERARAVHTLEEAARRR